MRRTSYFGAVSGRAPAGVVPLRPHRPLFSPRETGPAFETASAIKTAPARRSKPDPDISDSVLEAQAQPDIVRTVQPPTGQFRQPEIESRTEVAPEIRPIASTQSRTVAAPSIHPSLDSPAVRAPLPPAQSAVKAVSQIDVPTRRDEPNSTRTSQFLSPAPVVPERTHIEPRPELSTDRPDFIVDPIQSHKTNRQADIAIVQVSSTSKSDPPRVLVPAHAHATQVQPDDIVRPVSGIQDETSTLESLKPTPRSRQETVHHNVIEPARLLQPREPEARPEPKVKRSEGTVHIGSIEVEIVSQPAAPPAAPRPPSVVTSRSAVTPASKRNLSRGLSMHFGMRQG